MNPCTNYAHVNAKNLDGVCAAVTGRGRLTGMSMKLDLDLDLSNQNTTFITVYATHQHFSEYRAPTLTDTEENICFGLLTGSGWPRRGRGSEHSIR